jgi:hypothetical protein
MESRKRKLGSWRKELKERGQQWWREVEKEEEVVEGGKAGTD